MAKFILLGLALASRKHSSLTPRHVQDLYDALDKKDAPKLAVHSEGNFQGVHHLVPDKTSPVVIKDAAELCDAVRDGTVDAALISGLPQNDTGLVTFSSTIVSVRSMFSAPPADTLRLAIDAAIVRALHGEEDRKAAARNPPFEYLAVHTCRTDEVERFPFPDAVEGDRLSEAKKRGALRISSISGPTTNWLHEGDYRQDPPVGFWPEFYNAIEKHFREGTGIGFERVVAESSGAAMDLVLDGNADVIEPYWMMDSYYNQTKDDPSGVLVARQHVFVSSCTTLGYDKTFIVKDLDRASEVEETRVLKNKVAQLQKKLDDLDSDSLGVASAMVAAVALFLS